ncbi:MAG: undecaprenyl/decaprenyl-phosphate alpha-N-acetylglucosaminyl 1-phosphate transferase [Magnetococcales bacterium]|nr:undecaprenyl/decaprenyl-phosphate alpha-N-acetylglucosaminyl 1-phosphate transferase [Magnetococcales bacterium]
MTETLDTSMFSLPFYEMAIVAGGTLFWLFVGVVLAPNLGLVDKPWGHKKHKNNTPLVGGIALFLGLMPAFFLFEIISPYNERLWWASFLILAVGVWDDITGLSIYKRFFLEFIIATIITVGGGLTVKTLGNLIGFGEVELGVFAVPFTVICIVGVINALNMVDGIDGLLVGLTIVSLTAMIYLATIVGRYGEAEIILIIISALIPVFIFNSRLLGQQTARIFMGDGGSKLMGLFLAWFTISLSQSYTPHNIEQAEPAFPAAGALWLLAIPLIELFSSILRRLLKGRNPFKPDLQHMHHLLLRAGFSVNHTLMIILGIATIMAIVATVAFTALIADSIFFVSLLGIYAVYCIFAHMFWQNREQQGDQHNYYNNRPLEKH